MNVRTSSCVWMVVVVAVLGLALAEPASAGGCGTACLTSTECFSCRFTFFTRTMCTQGGCNYCVEDSCWVAFPSQTADRIAATGTPLCRATEAEAVANPFPLRRLPVQIAG